MNCEAKRYGRSRECEGAVKFEVVYTTSTGTVADRHPACFSHGLAEVERHHASAGMSRCELKPLEDGAA
jgi:hypothetical protein